MSMDTNPQADLSQKIPAPLRVPGQLISPQSRCGPCDGQFEDSEHVLPHFRYATVWMMLDLAAGVFTLPAGQERVAFAEGVGEDAALAMGTAGFMDLTLADTNAGREGSLVGKDEVFTIYGISVRAGLPYQFSGGLPSFDETFDPYIPFAQAAVLEQTFLTAEFGDEAKEQHLGNPAQWGDTSGPTGGAVGVANGTYQNGVFLPFFMGALAGGLDSENALVIRVTCPRGIELPARTPIAAGANSMLVPLHIRLWGEMACADEIEMCADREDEKFAKRMRRVRAKGLAP